MGGVTEGIFLAQVCESISMESNTKEAVNPPVLSLLDEKEIEIESVLNAIEDPEDYEHLRQKVINRIKNEPHSARLRELLGIIFLELGMLKEAEKVSVMK